MSKSYSLAEMQRRFGLTFAEAQRRHSVLEQLWKAEAQLNETGTRLIEGQRQYGDLDTKLIECNRQFEELMVSSRKTINKYADQLTAERERSKRLREALKGLLADNARSCDYCGSPDRWQSIATAALAADEAGDD